MGLHRNAGGADLHDPKGKSPTPLDLDTNLDQAYKIVDTEDQVYLAISTIAGTQNITLGSTDVNPKLIQAGTGDVGFGTDTPTSPNGNAKVVEIEGTSVGLVLNSTNGSGVPWEIQHNSGDLKIIYDGADALGGGSKTAIALDAAGAMRLGSEVATPVAPAPGDGGQVYVKSDGILYYQSDTVAETDLTDSTGTGSGNFDDLTVNTNTLVANLPGYTDRVGIGTATPAVPLHITTVGATAPGLDASTMLAIQRAGFGVGCSISIIGDDTGESVINLGDDADENVGAISYDHTNDRMVFRTGATGDRVVIDSQGQVGIGTIAPDKMLEVNSADGENLRLTYNDTDGSAANYADFTTSSGGDLTITPSGGDASVAGTFRARCSVTTESDSNAMEIDAETYGNTTLLIDTDSIGVSTVTFTDDAATFGVGATLRFKDSTGDAAASNVVISPDGAETMDGAGSVTLGTNYGWVEFLTDGTNWFIVAGDGYSKD